MDRKSVSAAPCTFIEYRSRAALTTIATSLSAPNCFQRSGNRINRPVLSFAVSFVSHPFIVAASCDRDNPKRICIRSTAPKGVHHDCHVGAVWFQSLIEHGPPGVAQTRLERSRYA